MRVAKEFSDFINRGSVVDLAVGIVIGSAFTAVVRSLVDDVLMPPVGWLTKGVDFSKMYVNLAGRSYPTYEAAVESGDPLIEYGQFINAIMSFIIVAFAVFLLVRVYNRMRETKASEPAAPTEKECPYCVFKIPLSATRCAHCTSDLQAA